MGCPMLGDKYFSMVYHDVFLSWFAQRWSLLVLQESEGLNHDVISGGQE